MSAHPQLVRGSSRSSNTLLQCAVRAALARYTPPMEDTIEMDKYPKITINLDHLPQGFQRKEVVHIPILIDIRAKPTDQSKERRESTRVLKGEGESIQKAARISSAEPPIDPGADALPVLIPESPPRDPAAASASAAPPPPKATVFWKEATPTVKETPSVDAVPQPVASPTAEAAPYNLSVPILLAYSAKASAHPPTPADKRNQTPAELEPSGADTLDYRNRAGSREIHSQPAASAAKMIFREMFGVESAPPLGSTQARYEDGAQPPVEGTQDLYDEEPASQVL